MRTLRGPGSSPVQHGRGPGSPSEQHGSLARRIWRGIAVLSVIAVLPLTAACEDAATQEAYTPGEGTWVNSGDIQLRNVVAVTDGNGAATLVATIFNQGESADAVTGIAVPGSGKATGLPLALPSSGVTVLGANTDLGQASTITLRSTKLTPGGAVQLTFEFEKAPPVNLDVLVVPNTGPYATVPAPQPIPSSTPKPQP